MLPKLYQSNPDFEISPVFMSDEALVEMLNARVMVCSDVLIINREQQTVILPWRSMKPADGIWPIGGMRKAGEQAIDTAMRRVRAETSLELNEERFTPLTIAEYIWDYRKEEPSDAGRHDMLFSFTIELDEPELKTATANLDENEYDATRGFTAYRREDLVNAGARDVIIDYYDLIFPGQKPQQA